MKFSYFTFFKCLHKEPKYQKPKTETRLKKGQSVNLARGGRTKVGK